MDLAVSTEKRPLLAVTVDGTWHALDADTGALLWTLSGQPLLSTHNSVADSNAGLMYNPVYLVEPVGEGALFAYIPGEAVHRLPLTVKMLVDKSPGRLADGTLHVGSVHASYFAIDLLTGRIVGTYDAREDGRADREMTASIAAATTKAVTVDESVLREIGSYKRSNVVLIGRTDYKVAVFRRDIQSPSFTARLSIFSAPFDLDTDAFSGHERVDHRHRQDSLHFYSSNNGILYGKERNRIKWIHKFTQPVLYVFQTVPFDGHLEAVNMPLQRQADSGSDFASAPATPHDVSLAHIGSIHDNTNNLYILNSVFFPQYKPLHRRQVSPSELAVSSSDDHLRFNAESCIPGSAQFPECLVGPRQVSRPYHVPLLEGGSAGGGPLISSLAVSIALTLLTTVLLTIYIRRSTTSSGANRGRNSSSNSRRTNEDKRKSGDGVSLSKMQLFEDQVIGHGSQGTMVLKGMYEGRSIAVKRVLSEYFAIAEREVQLLQHSDAHPNVVRYYCTEASGPFIYIALELCDASLADLVERPLSPAVASVLPHFSNGRDVLLQVTQGLQHLHSLGIVHRDLKPGNILISKPSPKPRVLISDFGLSRRLDPGQSHFHPTLLSGTIGWRAPECIMSEESLKLLHSSATGDTIATAASPIKMTRKVDIFALGCIFYYVLSGGRHPFGESLHERELNISRHRAHSMSSSLVDSQPEAADLIERMLSFRPDARPDCSTVLRHPFFWPSDKRLAFLADLSDRLERGDRRDPTARALESCRHAIFGNDWHHLVDPDLHDDLGRYRKYFAHSVQDLLRAMRNKRHHWQELPEAVKRKVGDTPETFWRYFGQRFPGLLIAAYRAVERGPWRSENPFRDVYF